MLGSQLLSTSQIILSAVISVLLVLQFRQRGKEMVDFICDYYGRQVETFPVRSQMEVSGASSSCTACEPCRRGERLAEEATKTARWRYLLRSALLQTTSLPALC